MPSGGVISRCAAPARPPNAGGGAASRGRVFISPATASAEERIAVVARRDERLLDRARADPADQVPHRASLVVRAGCARAAERLLADDGAGRLVVDVEVARRVAQSRLRRVDRGAILGEDGAGEAVWRAAVDEVEHVLVLLLVVDVC